MYKTKSGDTFESIAFEIYGDCRCAVELMKANREYLFTYQFSAGVELEVPEIKKESTLTRPPWLR